MSQLPEIEIVAKKPLPWRLIIASLVVIAGTIYFMLDASKLIKK